MKMVTGTRLMLIQDRSSAGGCELLCVLVRKDVMAPNWRDIHIGSSRNALPATTMNRVIKKATKQYDIF